jgi:uncharacterized protein YhbP (UPF0306 family)
MIKITELETKHKKIQSLSKGVSGFITKSDKTAKTLKPFSCNNHNTNIIKSKQSIKKPIPNNK